MERKLFSRFAIAGVLALAMGLGGCSGSDGAPGAPGQDVDPAVVEGLQQQIEEAKAEAEAAKAEAEAAKAAAEAEQESSLSVAVAHKLKVPEFVAATIDDVSVVNGEIEFTFSVPGYQQSTIDVELSIAKWVPADNSWMSLIPRDRTQSGGIKVIRGGNVRLAGANAVSGGVAGTFTTKFSSPDADFGGPGPIDFSNGVVWRRAGNELAGNYAPEAGEYRDYVQGILDRINAHNSWDPNAIYRVAVTSRDNEAARFTAVVDFDGTGAIQAELTNTESSALSLNSCNSCHSDRVIFPRNEVHGHQRQDPNVCANCHNSYTFDSRGSVAEAGGWANISMTAMIHGIHSGTPDEYTVDGYEYKKVRFPDWTFGRGKSNKTNAAGLNRGTANCTACHKGDVDVPTLNTGWNKVVLNACTSCHTERAAGTGAFHLAEYDCSSCHTGATGPTAEQFHGVSPALATIEKRQGYQIKIIGVKNAVAGANALVSWQIVDDAGNPRPNIEVGDLANIRVGIGWGWGDDWTNDGGPSHNGTAGHPFNVTASSINTKVADGTFVTTVNSLPTEAAAGRNGYAAIYGWEFPAEDGVRPPHGFNLGSGEFVRPNTAVATITLDEDAVDSAGLTNERRVIADGVSCNSCHGTTGRHGTQASSDIASCVVCHNAGSLSRDGSIVQGTVDLMFMVHAIHGLADGKRDEFERRYAFDGGYDYVTYPSTVLDCNACHVNDSQNLPVDSAKRIGVIADGKKAAYLAGTGVNAPMSSVCFSCHEPTDNALKNDLKGHMTGMGGGMYGEQDHEFWLNRGEGCMACHK